MRRPHGAFFSMAITDPSASINGTLPAPAANITSMRLQQQPTQNSPLSVPSVNDCSRVSRPVQWRSTTIRGDRHFVRHWYFNDED